LIAFFLHFYRKKSGNNSNNGKKKKLTGSVDNLNVKFYNSNPEISSPLDFSHLVHVKYDAETGKYVGLPIEWEEKVNGTSSNKKFRI
jgi:hypothetical protein